jgi:hypothetical protein
MGTPPEPSAPAGGGLADRVRAGDDPELRQLAAQGLLPLPPEELIPLQVELTRDAEAAVAAAARSALAALEPGVAAGFVARHAGPDELAFFAAESSQSGVIEAVLRRRDTPHRLLRDLAPRLSPELQEVLVRRQDALVEEPTIADALETNPQLAPDVRRRLGEYRRHLLRGAGGRLDEARRDEPAPVPRYLPPLPGAPDEPDDDEVAAALAAAAAVPGGSGETDPVTGLTDTQIRSLPLPVRLRLARGAPRPLRAILIRDPSPLVAKTVLTDNTFTEQEIEQIASIRSLHEEVLAEIAHRRDWVSTYRVLYALVRNPRTPLAIGVRLVSRLSVRDLRLVSLDRNVSDAVRSTARRLYRIKRA